MNVAYIDGEIEFSSWDEVEAFIKERSRDLDDIWLSWGREYPCLAILLNTNYACVHYFLNDEGDIWQSIGYGDKSVEFINNDEKTEMPADAVISIEEAIKCAKQFYDMMDRPDCIEWREL